MSEALDIAIDLIKRFEGCRLHAYPDPGSGGEPWTIGWGSTGHDIGPDTVWTQEQADERLMATAMGYMQKAAQLCPQCASEPKKLAALTDFCYNLGSTRLAASTLRRRVNAEDWPGAQHEIKKWVWASGKKLPGLVKRRAAEAALLE